MAVHVYFNIHKKTAAKFCSFSSCSSRLADDLEWLKSTKKTLVKLPSATNMILPECKSLTRMLHMWIFLRACSAIGKNALLPADAVHTFCSSQWRYSCNRPSMLGVAHLASDISRLVKDAHAPHLLPFQVFVSYEAVSCSKPSMQQMWLTRLEQTIPVSV